MEKNLNGKKNKGGRPPEFTDETVKKLEEAFAIDATVDEACFYAGITRQTYYNHVKEDALEGTEARRLFDRFEGLRNRPVLKARQTIVKALDTPQYALEYLKRKRKLEFSERTETDLTSKNEQITGINYILPNANNNQTNV